ncbi:MAG: hypothetical protein ACRD2A_01005 [Vicinamibacterales bacterium]
MKLRILIAGTLVASALGMLVAADPVRSDMVVHEWGTFLAMNGSDGASLDGMYHEEHALPPFVHSRSRDQLRLPSSLIKGETPVIYFYTARRSRVQVDVGFPSGLWTQWYPQAAMVVPGLVQVGSPPQTRNGRITWNVEVVPPAVVDLTLPATSSDALWNHARKVDAAYVSAVNGARGGTPKEWERFIFYRGLGVAPLPIDVSAAGGRISATATEPAGLQHLFILRVENGRGAYEYVSVLEGGKTLGHTLPTMDRALPIDQFADRIAGDVEGRLVESGLYEKEARAMVNTWRSSYFKTDGIRVLFVLPQSWTDGYVPMRIQPAPSQLVRVMVGRVEVLTAEREQRAEGAIRNLGSLDSGVRERAFTALREEGRYVEPIIRRTLRASADERVRALCRQLLLTDFVTELRTALNDAETGEQVRTDPVYVRAQLASLLREVGLTKAAQQEGEAALARLQQMPQPTMSDHASRNAFRALARASEGAGNDAAALKWYGAFVEFGSQSRQCNGCHVSEGPREMSFFRDWYAGRKFAEYAKSTGEAARMIAAHEATLTRAPNNIAAQLGLAYLYEAHGENAKAQALWTKIDPAGKHQ